LIRTHLQSIGAFRAAKCGLLERHSILLYFAPIFTQNTCIGETA